MPIISKSSSFNEDLAGAGARGRGGGGGGLKRGGDGGGEAGEVRKISHTISTSSSSIKAAMLKRPIADY